jgi:mannose-6-phosphate isomerase-like protein (cupin superfamily)
MKLTIVLVSVSFLIILNAFVMGNPASITPQEVGNMLWICIEEFSNQVPADWDMVVQIDVTDISKSWHILFKKGKGIALKQGSNQNSLIIVTTTTNTLKKMFEGKIVGLTAGGKENWSNPAPLDIKLAKNTKMTPDIMQKIYFLGMHLFNHQKPERTLLGEEFSRKIHGANVVTLYYNPGFRSAWYMIKKNDKLNKPGDTNPFHQSFIFISGTGFAKIGNKQVKVKGGESYYIPPNSEHIVWTDSDEPLVLIWLAWGEGA